MTLLLPATPPVEAVEGGGWSVCHRRFEELSPLISSFRESLSCDELVRAERFHARSDQERYICGRGHLRVTLGAILGCDARHVAIAYGPFGKPGLDRLVHDAPIEFNISHTRHHLFVCVARDVAVGIDAEEVRDFEDLDDLARGYFHPLESAPLLSLPRPLRVRRFYEQWTLKEAYIKARGVGLTVPLSSFAITDAGAGPRLTVDEGGDAGPDFWSFVRLDLFPDVVCAVAIHDARRL